MIFILEFENYEASANIFGIIIINFAIKKTISSYFALN